MTLKLWRKVRSAYRIGHSSRKRPQLLPGRQLTKKQKKFFRYNRNFYSGEIAFPISKYTRWQLRNKLPANLNSFSASKIISTNLSLFWKLSLSPARTRVSLNKVPYINEEKYALFLFGKAHITPSLHGSKESLDNGKKKAYLNSGRIEFVRDWQTKNVFSTIRQLKVNWANLPWFFHNPSPIPGVFKIRRLGSSYLKQIQSNHNLSVYLGRFRQKNLLFLWNSCFFSPKDPSLWLVIQGLEGYWPLLLTKIGFAQRIFSRKQRIQHSCFLLNGQKILKIWRVAYPGDFLYILSKVFTLLR